MEHRDLEAALEGLHEAGLGWALACCGWDRMEAEDVLQTAYLKVLDGRARFAGRSSFRAFLLGVIRRTASERRRRARLARLLPERLGGANPRAVAPNPGEALARSREAARLVGALRLLPTRQRQVLHLVFYGELTIEEASRVMAVSLGTARTHYERGKRALRRQLAAGERAPKSGREGA